MGFLPILLFTGGKEKKNYKNSIAFVEFIWV